MIEDVSNIQMLNPYKAKAHRHIIYVPTSDVYEYYTEPQNTTQNHTRHVKSTPASSSDVNPCPYYCRWGSGPRLNPRPWRFNPTTLILVLKDSWCSIRMPNTQPQVISSSRSLCCVTQFIVSISSNAILRFQCNVIEIYHGKICPLIIDANCNTASLQWWEVHHVPIVGSTWVGRIRVQSKMLVVANKAFMAVLATLLFQFPHILFVIYAVKQKQIPVLLCFWHFVH